MPKPNPPNIPLINKKLYKTQYLYCSLTKTLRHADIFHVRSREMSGMKMNEQSN